MLTYMIASVIPALVVGFGAGFTTFRRSLQWCQVCGAGMRCIECARRHHPASQAGRASAERRGTTA